MQLPTDFSRLVVGDDSSTYLLKFTFVFAKICVLTTFFVVNYPPFKGGG